MAGLEKGLQVLAALKKQPSMKEEKDDSLDWEAINDPTAKLRKWLPPLTEEEEANMLHMPKLQDEMPVDENGDPMIMLPYFDEDDAFEPPKLAETAKRSVVLTRSISRAGTNFGSKAWDALFNAAQLAQQEGTAEHKELEDFKREAQQKYHENQEEIPMSSIYELLNETPEETKRRLKALRERNKRLATIHSSNRKHWMVKHGRVVRPELPEAMRLQLREAFDLIDQDGSGAIDVDELEEAFKVLGMDVSRKQVEKMMDDVDEDESGEVELAEFEQIMTAQMAGADDDNDSGGGAAGVPFHVMATSYRRKRLMDSIITSDYDGLRSLIEKAQQYKELADKQRAQMISEHLWISVKVAQRIRRFIRNWRKVRELREREKAMAAAEARQQALQQRMADGLVDEGEEEVIEEPIIQGPVKEKFSLRGERDMTALRFTERQIDQRTMEKIRMRAKMSSIVAALDAKEKLELQAFNAPVRRPENYYEAEDLSGLKQSLNKMFDISSQNKAALSKRMILAANAHRKLPKDNTRMSTSWHVRPDELKSGLQLTPRGRASAVVERLSCGKGSTGPLTTAAKLKSAAKRYQTQSRTALMREKSNHVNFEDHPRNSREELPPRASSCVPWLSDEKVGSSGAGNSEDHLSALLQRGLSTISEDGKKSKPRPKSRLSEKALDALMQDVSWASSDQPRSSGVTADGSMPSHQMAASRETLESSTGIVRRAPRATMKQQQTVGLHKRPKTPEPLPVVQHKHMLASATHSTNPYRRANQAPRMPGGRTSPTPFSAHLSGQIPGRVLPVLNEVPKDARRASTGARSPGQGPIPGGSTIYPRVAATAESTARLNPRLVNSTKHRQAKKHRTGPGNGVAIGLARSRAGEETVSNIRPSYVVGQDEPRRIGPGVARHFVEVMMDVPHTPQATTRPRWGGTTQDIDISSFPFEPRSPLMWGGSNGDL